MSILAATALSANAAVRLAQARLLGHGEKYALAAVMLLAAAAAVKDVRSQNAVSKAR